MQLEKYNFNNLLFFIFLYLTLVAGFAFDERLNYGTIYDNVINKHIINQFSINFIHICYTFYKSAINLI